MWNFHIDVHYWISFLNYCSTKAEPGEVRGTKPPSLFKKRCWHPKIGCQYVIEQLQLKIIQLFVLSSPFHEHWMCIIIYVLYVCGIFKPSSPSYNSCKDHLHLVNQISILCQMAMHYLITNRRSLSQSNNKLSTG